MTTNIDTNTIIETLEKDGVKALDLSSPDVFNTVMKLIKAGEEAHEEIFGNE